MQDRIAQLAETVRFAAADRRRLCIRAGGTKDFYGNPSNGERLDPRPLCGVVDFDPAELVLTARGGTPLAEVESLLAARGQMLGFEPPHFGSGATIGGCVAAGLAGPRATCPGPGRGAIRDFVLGAQLLDGRGRLLRFGGTVIKNVAGYDLARALAGSLGILGVIIELSLRVVPKPICEITLQFELDEVAALERMNAWGRETACFSAAASEAGRLTVRLSGARAAVVAVRKKFGGEALADGDGFWSALREQRSEFFAGDAPVWRLSVPSNARPVSLGASELIEGAGSVRWLRTGLPAAEVRRRAAELGGIATLFRGGSPDQGVFAPLPPVLMRINAALKAEFDPAGIFNFGRLIAGL
ncbi:MAG TPA: glycolate oxidase subunit GlcE [Steroidobacteraceae bacterium]|jgi:glycolate oxidase FAD binding subunit|nr:glycolate oxidase subunit GlcE [Steroidobacteraceae bacterium]